MTPPPVHAPGASDALQRRTLRRLFLTLFLRGHTARGLSRGSAPTSLARKMGGVVLLYALLGVTATTFVHEPTFALSLFLHTMTFVTVGMFVVGAAGEVLFNAQEPEILLHRPVGPRTLLWSKVRVLIEVALWIAGAMNLAGLVIGTLCADGSWRYPLIHVVSITLVGVFCAGCVVLTYQVCLRWLGRERLDSVMTIVQVAVAILFVLGMQIGPRMIETSPEVLRTLTTSWWLIFVPPAWFAALDTAVAGSGTALLFLFAALGLGATALVCWLAFVRLGARYEEGLQRVAEAATTDARRGARLRRLVAAPPLRWWLRDPVERGSFLLTTAYLTRDRDVRLRVYPSLAPMILMPVAMSVSQGGAPHRMLALVAGFTGTLPLLAAALMQYSQQWQASDLFRVAPIAGPAAICNGSRKALMLFLVGPMFLFLGVALALMHGGVEQWMLMLPGLVTVPVYALMPYALAHTIPLARPTEEAKAASRALMVIPAMIGAAVVSTVGMLSWSGGWFETYMIIELALAAACYLLLRRAVAGMRWPKME